MIGSRIGHFRIVARVGAGGMGEVYRARDEHLERDVALKVLPVGLLADERARRRFRREALAISRLNHPNIATVHDFATYEATDVLVMEYVAGQPMSDRIATGALGEDEAVRLATHLVEGLAAAHAEGVVHRDIKPGNLRVLPDGRLKILDFGLATLRQRGTDDEQQTRSAPTEAVVAGTLPYMSPEQVRGEAVDARSDIYAVGVTLYEMVTGQRPFPDTDALRLAEAIVHEPCPPPGRLAPRLSPSFEQVILKCTEKDPALRYQSTTDLLVDLRRLSGRSSSGAGGARPPRPPRPRRARHWAVAAGVGTLAVLVAVVVIWLSGWFRRAPAEPATTRLRSVAVLPLANLSGDPQQEYFVDGMTEALRTDLAKIRALKVISRTSAMQYKSTRKSLPEIGRELGVGAVVEGSVLHVGNRVRIAAELVNAATDQQLWAQSYEREVRDVLALHGEVARAIAREIQVVLTPREQQRLTRRRQVDPRAHEAYLHGISAVSRLTPADADRGIALFEQAIGIDPTFAEARAALAFVCLLRGLAVNGGLSDEATHEVLGRARAAAARALDTDDTIASAHGVLAAIALFLDCDLPYAEERVGRALELDANSGMAHSYAGLLAMLHGRREEARREFARTVELDPIGVWTRVEAGEMLFWMRDYDRAIDYVTQGLAREPGYPRGHFVLGRIRESQGRIPDALAEYQMAGFSAEWIRGARRAFEAGGRSGFDRWQLSRLLAQGRAAEPLALARAYLRVGRLDDAMATLERARQTKEPMLFLLTSVEWYSPLQGDSRFVALVRRLGLPQ
jgi:eukaryotic-like serine/threonine-protein kinase